MTSRGREQKCDEFARVAADAQAAVPRRAARASICAGSVEPAQPPLARAAARRPRPSRPSKVVKTGVPSATASRFIVPPAEITRSA